MSGCALPSTDYRYGRVCPECAGPKSKQAAGCRACYADARRRGEYPNPPVLRREQKPNWKGGVSLPKGGSRGRQQSQSHPWRRHNAQLFRPSPVRLEAVQTSKGTGSSVV